MEKIHYREYLNNVLKEKKARNPSYSLRAFAKHLQIPASVLSKALSMKGTISLRTAGQIVRRLQLNEEQAGQFLLSLAEESLGEETSSAQ